MNAFLRDLRYSGRLLAKSPAFTTAVILSLAIGIGANAAIFSLINGILLKPLPFKDSEQLVTLWEQPFKDRVAFASLSGPDYKECKEQSQLLESLSAFTRRKPSGSGQSWADSSWMPSWMLTSRKSRLSAMLSGRGISLLG